MLVTGAVVEQWEQNRVFEVFNVAYHHLLYMMIEVFIVAPIEHFKAKVVVEQFEANFR